MPDSGVAQIISSVNKHIFPLFSLKNSKFTSITSPFFTIIQKK